MSRFRDEMAVRAACEMRGRYDANLGIGIARLVDSDLPDCVNVTVDEVVVRTGASIAAAAFEAGAA